MSTSVSKPSEVAEKAVAFAKQRGMRLAASGTIVTVSMTFEPGDRAAYVTAESDANTVLRMFRMVYPGSVWGTDSGSVGGYAGMTGGYVRFSKSGVSKREVSALRKAAREAGLTDLYEQSISDGVR